jgi:hypothetical protein
VRARACLRRKVRRPRASSFHFGIRAQHLSIPPGLCELRRCQGAGLALLDAGWCRWCRWCRWRRWARHHRCAHGGAAGRAAAAGPPAAIQRPSGTISSLASHRATKTSGRAFPASGRGQRMRATTALHLRASRLGFAGQCS